jgi:phosphoglycerol transferase MdoB-like AlkP superfamily enzyme
MGRNARNALLALSVVDCIFGLLYLSSSGDSADVFLGINFSLAALLTVLTWQDLRKRGWTWQAPVVGVSYLVAPLIGLMLYAITSNRPQREPSPLIR